MTNKRGFTLLELIVVIIIIAVLATMSITHYVSTRESVLDKQTIANLKLMREAERVFKVETGNYYPSSGTESDIGKINTNLGLLLRVGTPPAYIDRYWDYSVKSTGCSQAARKGGDGRIWYLEIHDSDEEPNKGAGCP